MVRRTKKGGSLRIDFSGVENRGRFHTEGDYLLRVKEVTQEKGDKADYLNWVIECAEGEDEGAVLYNNTSLAPQSLWNVKAFLEALGVEVPDDEMDLDLPEYVGLEFMGTVEMEPWEGKKRPRLADFWAAEEKPAKKKRGSKKDDADDEDEDEKPKRGSKKAGKKKEPDPVSEDEINDMDQEELADLIAENDLDVDLADFKTLRKMRAAVIDAAQEAGIVGEAEDTTEEDEKPKRGGKKDDADDEEDEKPARRSRSPKKDDDDEEDEKPARSRRRR